MAQIALFFMASLLDVFIPFMGDFYMKVVYLQTCSAILRKTKSYKYPE